MEYAKRQREGGVPRREATLAACQLRLRPIVMTSVAFILGVVPLVLSEGAGAEMRRALGTAVFAGMLGVTLFGIFLTPVFFYVLQWFGRDIPAETKQTADAARSRPCRPTPTTGGHPATVGPSAARLATLRRSVLPTLIYRGRGTSRAVRGRSFRAEASFRR